MNNTISFAIYQIQYAQTEIQSLEMAMKMVFSSLKLFSQQIKNVLFENGKWYQKKDYIFGFLVKNDIKKHSFSHFFIAIKSDFD